MFHLQHVLTQCLSGGVDPGFDLIFLLGAVDFEWWQSDGSQSSVAMVS